MSRFKVLLVDDDSKFVDQFGEALAPHFDISTALSAKDALEKSSEVTWDAVVIDIEMPLINGFELFKQMKVNAPNTCYMFLTCHTDDTTYIQSLSLDPDDFLGKPITPQKLIAAINHRLRYKQSSNIFTYHGIEIDTERGVISNNSEKIDLTKKEQQVLLMLVRSRGQKVLREELIENVWGDLSVSAHTLHTHLTNLRKKIATLKLNVYVDRDGAVYLTQE